MGSPDRRALRNFAAYFLAWTGSGLFFFTQDVARNLAYVGDLAGRAHEHARCQARSP